MCAHLLNVIYQSGCFFLFSGPLFPPCPGPTRLKHPDGWELEQVQEAEELEVDAVAVGTEHPA